MVVPAVAPFNVSAKQRISKEIKALIPRETTPKETREQLADLRMFLRDSKNHSLLAADLKKNPMQIDLYTAIILGGSVDSIRQARKVLVMAYSDGADLKGIMPAVKDLFVHGSEEKAIAVSMLYAGMLKCGLNGQGNPGSDFIINEVNEAYNLRAKVASRGGV